MKNLKYSSSEIRNRAVAAVQKGMSVIDVSNAFHTHRSTVHRWVHRFKKEGKKGLDRRLVSGRPRILGQMKDEDFLSIVLKPASDFNFETDFWTCKRICQVIQKKFKIFVSRWTVWRTLRELGLTYQKPEKKYFEASESVRAAWLREELPKINRAVKQFRAILYFQDESHIALAPVLARTWAPCGKTPIQFATGVRGGMGAMSAISSKGDLIFTLHDSKIRSPEIIHFLSQMLQHHPRRHLVVVMDNASPHKSKMTSDFILSQKRLHVFYLPPYSPDWNPDEKVWNQLKNQELKGHQAKNTKELKKLVKAKLEKLSKNSKKVESIFFRCFVAKLLH